MLPGAVIPFPGVSADARFTYAASKGLVVPTQRCARCLVADDDPLIRWSVVRFLERFCTEARSAASGELALAFLQEWPVDYLITEVRLPGMDGLELARRFRDIRRPRWVILLTGSKAALVSVDLDTLGVIGVIEKPLVLESLAELLSRFLENPTGAAA